MDMFVVEGLAMAHVAVVNSERASTNAAPLRAVDGAVEVRFTYLRDDLAGGAQRLFMVAALMAVTVIVVFRWGIGSVVIWTLVGAAIWGSVSFVLETRARVPTGRLPDAPANVVVNGRGGEPFRRLSRALFAVASGIGLAWLADRWDLGALFVPGQFVGYACAAALGALLVARWERKAGRRVLFDSSTNDQEPRLYVAPSTRDVDPAGSVLRD
jgi:hypothetical protein